VLKTNADGTATLARGALGALGTVFGVNGSSAITGATLVTPALGTPASGVLTNCTGVPAAALPAGTVLQVVYGSYATPVSNSTTTIASTGLTASITPKSVSNKILVIANISSIQNNDIGNGVNLSLFRNSTGLYTFGTVNGYTNSAIVTVTSGGGTTRLDSPATTSATSYTVYFASNTGGGQVVTVQANNTESTMTLMEIAG
jgi:hypothetical protein